MAKLRSDDRIRIHCISVRLNNNELQILNIKRGNKSKGEWLRMLFLQNLPPVVPTINTEAWKKLSDISQKLNRISLHIDSKSKDSQLTHTELFAVKRQLQELRQHLLNAEIWSKPYEGYAEDQKGYELRWCCSLCIAAKSTS
ncbi:TPA: hypothetical protein ACN7FZ_005213 [Klebsiella pneumoniae]